MPDVNASRCPIDIIMRVSDYLWAKKTPLPANYRKEVDSAVFCDYKPLMARAESLILRAVEV